jgi:sugar transferase EpsL
MGWEMSKQFYRRYFKRIFDFTTALLVLLCIWPLLLMIYFLLRLSIGAPVLFQQTRPGLKGKLFTVYKFRTMTDMRNSLGQMLPDAERITRVGQILRSFSLDELPEIFNVLKGDMSLVGPRPLLMQYLERYNPEQARRHDVPPGITGWAQINGRNDLAWEEKFNLDVWYVDNQSLKLDIYIIVKTFWKVFRREGISHEGYATAPEFMGSSLKAKHPSSGTEEKIT